LIFKLSETCETCFAKKTACRGKNENNPAVFYKRNTGRIAFKTLAGLDVKDWRDYNRSAVGCTQITAESRKNG
jgi:hypothetical protein